MTTIYLYSGLPASDKTRQKTALEALGNVTVKLVDIGLRPKFPAISADSLVVYDTTFSSHKNYECVRRYVRNTGATFITGRFTPGQIANKLVSRLPFAGITI